MIIYFIDKTTLEIKDVIEASSYIISLDEETNAKSLFNISKNPNANQGDYLIAKKNDKTLYQGIIEEIQGQKNTNKITINSIDISNIFDRKIYETELTEMDTSLEDFLFYTINRFFKNGDNDSKLSMSYLEIVQNTQTAVKEPTNAEDGIYNFHTFMTNCRQNKNIDTKFDIDTEKITVTIENKGNETPISIDTTNNDVINYDKIYEVDITSKVIVICGDTGNKLEYYLLNNKTITTNKNDSNRADGVVETIYVAKEEEALDQATNIFKGNRYKHLVEFEIKKDSKLINTSNLTIGKPIIIKTKDGILESYISSITYENTSNFIKYKSGNIRINLIDKLKQEPYKIGQNKIDKSGGIINGNLNITNGEFKKNGVEFNGITITKIWDDPTVTSWDRGYMGLDISDYDYLILYGSNNSTIVPADFDTYLTWGGWYNTVQKDAVSHRHIYSSYNSTTNKQDIYWDYCSWWSVNGFTGSGNAPDINHPRKVYGVKII